MMLEKERNNRFCERVRGAIQAAEKPGTKREIPPLSVQTGCPYGAAAWRLDGEQHIPSSTLTKNYERVFGSDEIGTLFRVELVWKLCSSYSNPEPIQGSRTSS